MNCFSRIIIIIVLMSSRVVWSQPVSFYFGAKVGEQQFSNFFDLGKLRSFIESNDQTCIYKNLSWLQENLKTPSMLLRTDRLEIAAGKFDLEVRVGLEWTCLDSLRILKTQLQTAPEMACEKFILEPVVYLANRFGSRLISRLYSVATHGPHLQVINRMTKKAEMNLNVSEFEKMGQLGVRACVSRFPVAAYEFVSDDATAVLQKALEQGQQSEDLLPQSGIPWDQDFDFYPRREHGSENFQ